MNKLFHKISKPLFCTILICIMQISCAGVNKNRDSGNADFKKWTKNFTKKALENDISKATIEDFKQNVKFEQNVIKFDRTQPSAKRLTIDEYLNKVISQQRIDDAREYLKENKTILNEISTNYQVQPQFIVALWGLESNFGKKTGNYLVINSLATLAFEGRRHEFFSDELIKALKIIDAGNIAMLQMKGSWAGAVGQTQFMPSSYLKFAVDYDGDGKKDIWNNKSDVFASIANYLSQTKWKNNENWGQEVKLEPSFNKKLIDKTTKKTVEEWQKLGVKSLDGKKIRSDDDTLAYLVMPDQSSGKIYLAYKNFDNLLKWNKSDYFVISVGTLADKIAKEVTYVASK